jgi:tetratricopeptide (TPR) repeat protein
MTFLMNFLSQIAVLGLALTSAAPAPLLAAVDPRDASRLEACIAKTQTAPQEAYEDGLVWRSQSGAVFAEQCIALARIANGDISGGASRLAALASAPDAGDSDNRALLLAKAANAWLMIGAYDPALRALNAALVLKPGEVDLLIDRARTLAGINQWSKAQEDLTLALSKRPSDALIFRLRAETNVQLKNYDAADRDVAQALLLAPRDVEGYIMRGRALEARRLGRVPD